MDHQDALRDVSVEKYLLGELTGEPREIFEEHLFDCEQCAADLQAGRTFLQAARAELAAPAELATPAPALIAQRRQPARVPATAWLRSPRWLIPALAACLMLIAYQSLSVIPGMRRQLAQSDSPAILNNLVLTGGASRGAAGIPHITAPAHGSFLISVDIPARPAYSSYLCSLYAPTGSLVWSGSVSPQQVNDTVQIRVPSAVTRAGENVLVVQGVSQGAVQEAGQGSPSGAKLDDLARHSFLLELNQ